MDSVDRVIWILPILGVLDVVSTLYVESLGYPLALYEAGLFASFFVGLGLTYVYIPIYLLSLVALSYALWYIKNEKLDASHVFDKVLFLFLVLVACFVYVRLTVAFTGNFLLPYYLSGAVDAFLVSLLIYLSTAFTLGLYLWRDVVVWVTSNGDETK